MWIVAGQGLQPQLAMFCNFSTSEALAEQEALDRD
jgi:hypothetical protein